METMKITVCFLLLVFFLRDMESGVIRAKDKSAKNKKKSNAMMNYYTFWKTVTKDLIPRNKQLLEVADVIMNDMCKCQPYNGIDVTENKDCIDVAIEKEKELDITTSPENKILWIKNKNKFMKRLAKNTFKVLSGYKDALKSIQDTVCNKSQCLENACHNTEHAITRLDEFLKDLRSTMSGYFKLKIRPSRGRSISEAEKHLAYVYGFILELTETENALDFIVKVTWDAYVSQTPEMLEFEHKNTDLGLY